MDKVDDVDEGDINESIDNRSPHAQYSGCRTTSAEANIMTAQLTKPVTIALVGMSGVMQDAHIPNLLDLQFEQDPLFQIAAICDRDPVLSKSIASALRVDEMDMDAVCADPRIEAVLIATPPPTHLRLFRQALAAGKHIFIEKPLTFSISEARELAELARNAKSTVQVGYMFRHHRDALLTKKRLQEGAVGTVLSCTNIVIASIDPVWPRRFPTPPREGLEWGAPDPEDPDKLSFNMWSDNSVHYLNLMQWWFGPVEAVYGQWRQNGPMMMLRYKSGVLATHVFGPAKLFERRDFAIMGSEGMIDVTLHYPFQRNIMGRYAELRADDRTMKLPMRDHSDMYREELIAFARAINAGQTGDPEGTFEMGVHDMLTVKAAHRSSRSGREEFIE